ncbi:MAG: hypothetical protein ACXVCY_01440 [Pseudobdellovibrionaceae bacterium]
MTKLFFVNLITLFCVSFSYAATENITMKSGKADTADQFNQYVMKGFNSSLEYSSLGGEFHLKAYIHGDTVTYTANTNAPASAIGFSANYANLPRSNFGWSAGATLINKTENDSKDQNSLKSLKSFTQFRPEANLGYAFSNGFYGMAGGHVSILTTSDTEDFANPVGVGAQAVLGYIPARNFGVDIGYYVSLHRLSDKYMNKVNSENISVSKDESIIVFNQLRARATYYF